MSSENIKVLLLFGMSGAGKTYLGELISSRLGYFHYELDRDLTPAMRAAIAAKRSFTEQERDEYFEQVVVRMQEILTQHPKTVFTQGVYKERHREALRRRIPGLETVWVQAPQSVIQNRLQRREGGVPPDYAEMITRNFEVPLAGRTLVNDEICSEELLRRFKALFGA